MLNAGLEQRVRIRTAELEASNKELEAFSFSVSHDLRGPLRTIDGFSQALIEDYAGKLDAEGLDYLQRVRAGCQSMGRQIDDLLNLSRLTRAALRREPVDLSAMAERIARDLQCAEPGRRAEFRISPGPPGPRRPQPARSRLHQSPAKRLEIHQSAGCGRH